VEPTATTPLDRSIVHVVSRMANTSLEMEPIVKKSVLPTHAGSITIVLVMVQVAGNVFAAVVMNRLEKNAKTSTNVREQTVVIPMPRVPTKWDRTSAHVMPDTSVTEHIVKMSTSARQETSRVHHTATAPTSREPTTARVIQDSSELLMERTVMMLTSV